MNKDTLLEAVIDIGKAIQWEKWRKEREEGDERNKEHRCDVGYPVGTILFTFSYDDGIETLEVVDRQRVKQSGMESSRCFTTDDIVSETVEGAIRAAIESLERSGKLHINGDIAFFERELEYYRERMEWMALALRILRERVV